jgi:hypothetical protein
MTKDEFYEQHNEIRDRVTEKYGSALYYLANSVINNSKIEQVLEAEFGLSCVRESIGTFMAISQIYDGETHIGCISNGCIGFPEVLFYGHDRMDLVKEISKNDLFIKPTKGIHRILEWHDVEDKLQVLANDVVIYSQPCDLSNKDCENILKEIPQDLIDDLKKQESEMEIKVKDVT